MAETVTGETISKLSVMIIDDSSYMLALVATILRMFEVSRVETSRYAADGLQMLLRYDPDLILVNFHLDTMDGPEVVKAIRTNPAIASGRAPIILFSAFGELKFVKQARDAGANDYLIKPFSPRTLMEHMVAVLRNPRDFVAALDYTGPDRRLPSRQADFAGEERRDDLSTAEQDAVAETYEAATK